jgi:hypothetical protein
MKRMAVGKESVESVEERNTLCTAKAISEIVNLCKGTDSYDGNFCSRWYTM